MDKKVNITIPIGGGLIALGIIFIAATMNRWLSYSFMGAGVLVIIIGYLIQSKKK